MTDPRVRAATRADVRAICRIGEAAWTAAYGELLDDETIAAAIAEWYDIESVRDDVARRDVPYFVAEGDGHVTGYVSGGPAAADGVATLGAIYVEPDRWNEGIGTALLGRFERYCRRHGYGSIRLRVLAGNGIGQSFYRKHGYEAVEERETDLFGERIEERVFRKTLG